MRKPILIAIIITICAIGAFTGMFVAMLSNKEKTEPSRSIQNEQIKSAASTSQQQVPPVHTSKNTISSGLKIKADSITIPFSSSEIGTKFTDAPSDNKLPHLVGTTKDQIALLEILGNKDDVIKISMAVAIVQDRKDILEKGHLYMMGLVKNALPSWVGGSQWILDSLEKVVKSSSTTTSTTYDNFRITLTLDIKLRVFLLTIEKM